MRLNKVTTKKGTLEFKHVGPAYDFDSAAEAFDILLDGRKILTLLLDCAVFTLTTANVRTHRTPNSLAIRRNQQ